MNKLLCIDATACKVFKIEGGVDLGIYVFNGTSNKIEVLSSLAQSCINKICFTGGTTLKQKCTSGVSGWR